MTTKKSKSFVKADWLKLMAPFADESDRGAALLFAAVIDNELGDLLRRSMVEHKVSDELFDQRGPLSAFAARIDICLALGLIDEAMHKQLHLIRKVRNHFAHHPVDMTFEDPLLAIPIKNMHGSRVNLGGTAREQGRHAFLTTCAYYAAHIDVILNFNAQRRSEGRGMPVSPWPDD